MTRDAAILIAARKISGLTQSELAGKLNVSTPTVYRMERGDPRVKTETWAKAAGLFGMAFDWEKGEIIPGNKVPAAAIERVLRENAESAESEDEPGIDPTTFAATSVPTWDVEVSAGVWIDAPICELNSNDPEQKRAIDAGRFRLHILGACMEPDYPSGMTIEFEILIGDRDVMEPGKDYVVCKNDGTSTFKRLVKQDADAITLAALNQTEFPGTIEVARQEVCRVAKVAFRLQPPPAAKVPKIAKKAGTK